MVKILYEDNHLLVVVKPNNMPVCLDDSKDENLTDYLKQYIKEKYNRQGNVYLGLVHRLDRPVGGVMVFAKTSKCAGRLSEQVREHKFIKEYHLICLNKTSDKGKFIDKLSKDSKTNVVTVNELGKDAILEYELIDYNKEFNYSLIKVNLITGRPHQIRVQFAHHGYPLIGDQKYNLNTDKMPICLFANKLSFLHPVTGELLVFESKLPTNRVFNLFK